ncbi:glycosyltransferase family 2 protein (plasmid) [Leisingera aquaemixtae]|uniref:Glycosyltransferase family 2 protein n=1 Tax=Leisingera aquaemixtae TaxID=1396826 RepID=A0ABY5WQJ3_9RHOB|nr:glycosyltransferase family A protein [Leisingera aquaemixtae]UWQ43770.1 glycosyltransferase family 2 protein [Leisingera aquaemixtae]
MADAPPEVSVVVPTYNRGHLICEALDSVQAQTFRDLEIIVIDDGSEDDTAARVSAWAKTVPLPVVYEKQPNAGGNAARNRGIERARGRFVAFLDSDDLWHPQKIEKQMARLAARPEFGAVYCGLRETDAESGRVIAEPRHAFPEGDLLNALLVSDVTAPTSAYTVRRRLLIEAGKFDLALAARQDWDMWIRLARLAPIGCVPEALADLRQHPGPRTVSDPARELRAHKRILDKYAALRRRRAWWLPLAARAGFHRRTGRVQFHYLGRRGAAIRQYLIAIALWPFAADSWAALLGAFLPAGIRGRLRRRWNSVFGRTFLAIRNH